MELEAQRLTYGGWIQRGRHVRAGQKAGMYLLSPDGTESRATFTFDQTLPYDVVDGIWTELVTAENRPSKKKAEPKKNNEHTIKVAGNDSITEVWCGTNKRAAALLKQSKFSFDNAKRRWVRASNAYEIHDVLVERGYTVIDETDGPDI